MKISKIIFCVFIFLFFKSNAFSQYFSSGQDPFCTKWKMIKTESFKIIFPENFIKQAQYLGNTLEFTKNRTAASLNIEADKTTIILHNQLVTSNAFASLAPKRIEFFTCPPQDIYSQPWLEQLSIHEYRHIEQFKKINQGFTEFLTYLLGQQGNIAITGLFVPMWFIEGDAVCTETALSKSGRGRVPQFSMPLRAQILEKGKYSYTKATLGSFKDFIPDYYILGYNLVAQSRKMCGMNLWNSALNTVGKYPFIITPFSKGIKNITGLTKRKLYNITIDELEDGWETQSIKEKYSFYDVINPENEKWYTNYKLGVFIDKDKILAEKTGIDDITRFVIIDKNGEEKKIFTPGITFHEMLSYSDNKICWAEKTYDARWQNRNYSIIKIHNLKTKRTKKLTRKSRYFAPSFSPDGKYISAVEVSENNNYSLVLLDPENGNVLKKYTTKDNSFIITPSWSYDSKKIVFMTMNKKGKSISILDLKTSLIKSITPYKYTEISTPVFYKSYILFTGAFSGIDNIYAIDTLSEEIFRVSSTRYGARDVAVSPNKKSFIFSNYSSRGYQIVKAKADPDKWEPLEKIEDNSLKLFESISKEENWVLNSDSIPEKEYEVKSYSRISNLFNFHSWAPVSIDVNNTSFKPGASIMSQNKLSTAFTTLGYEYDINEKYGKFYADFTYKGWYPVLDLHVDNGKRWGVYTDSLDNETDYSWQEKNVRLGAYLPLNLSSGKYFRWIQPGIFFSQKFLKMSEFSPVEFINNNINTIDYSLYFSNTLKTSAKDMFPQWGQVFYFRFSNTPFSNTKSNILGVAGNFYFPALLKHHGVKLYFGYHKKKQEDYTFNNIANYPRGFILMADDELYSFAINYKFPLFYPDFGIGQLIYFKRVKLNLFYDQAIGFLGEIKNDYNSCGAEFTSDFHLFNFPFLIDAGIRSIYLPEQKILKAEFLFSIDFSGFY